jgi:hypothetical protein
MFYRRRLPHWHPDLAEATSRPRAHVYFVSTAAMGDV